MERWHWIIHAAPVWSQNLCKMEVKVLGWIVEGCLAGPIGRACDSWSQGEFEPHTEHRDYRKEKKKMNNSRCEDTSKRLEQCKKGLINQGMWGVLRSQKRQGKIFPLWTSWRNQPCQHLDFSPMKLISLLASRKGRKKHLCCFKQAIFW